MLDIDIPPVIPISLFWGCCLLFIGISNDGVFIAFSININFNKTIVIVVLCFSIDVIYNCLCSLIIVTHTNFIGTAI